MYFEGNVLDYIKHYKINAHFHNDGEKKRATTKRKTGQTFYLITFSLLVWLWFFFASVNISCPELFPFQLFSDLHIAIPVLAVIISIIFFNLCYCFCFGTPIFWWIKWRRTKIDGACITKKIAFEAKKNTRANKRNSWYWNIIRINENGNGNGKWNSQIVVLSM